MGASATGSGSERNVRGEAIGLLLALLLALLAALPALAGPGIVNTRAGGDSPFLVLRTHQMAQALRAGAFPVRWMPEAAYGLGYPAYHYYAALPYYLSALGHLGGLGVLGGIKLAQALGCLLAGGAAYGLARAWGLGRPGALLASAAYSYAPFHLVNLYVRGDALSEFWAMALFPLLLWLALLAARRATLGRLLGLSLSYAALIVTHNISALIFTPFLGLWMLALHGQALRRREWGPLLANLGALALGLALSAWFWLPALADRDLVQLHEQTTGYFHYAGHFSGLDLVQRALLFDYTLTYEQNPFRMGLVQALLIVAGLVVLAVRWRRLGRVARLGAALAAATLAATTFLMTPLSEPIWRYLPLLEYAQFPWRLLSIQALAGALLAGALPDALGRRWAAWLAGGALAVLLAVTGLARLDVDRLALEEADITPYRLMLYEAYSGNVGGTVRYEFLPAEMWPRPYVSGVLLNQGAKPAPLALSGALESAELLARTAVGETWRLRLGAEGLIAFHTTGWPGWRAAIGELAYPVQTLPGLGLVGVYLPSGEHVLTLTLGDTRAARWSERLALLAALAWLGLLAYALAREPRYRWRALAAALPLLWIATWLLLASPREAAPTRQGPLVMDYGRAPYLHRPSGGVQMGPARLADYALSAETLGPGDTLRLTTVWEGAPADALLRVELVALTAHLFPGSPAWAWGEAPVAAGRAEIALTLSSWTPPGLYVLRPTLVVGGVAQPAETADGRALSLLALAPVQVRDAAPTFEPPAALAAYGPPESPPVITLREAHAYLAGGGVVQVELLWRSEAQAPRHYQMSVRVRAADGAQLAARDLPPLAGNYPTGLWRPGHLYADALQVALPADADPARATDVEIVLYDLQTLAAIGSVVVPME
jgi:hypothetical protein